jgi:hypothetical protein
MEKTRDTAWNQFVSTVQGWLEREHISIGNAEETEEFIVTLIDKTKWESGVLWFNGLSKNLTPTWGTGVHLNRIINVSSELMDGDFCYVEIYTEQGTARAHLPNQGDYKKRSAQEYIFHAAVHCYWEPEGTRDAACPHAHSLAHPPRRYGFGVPLDFADFDHFFNEKLSSHHSLSRYRSGFVIGSDFVLEGIIDPSDFAQGRLTIFGTHEHGDAHLLAPRDLGRGKCPGQIILPLKHIMGIGRRVIHDRDDVYLEIYLSGGGVVLAFLGKQNADESLPDQTLWRELAIITAIEYYWGES